MQSPLIFDSNFDCLHSHSKEYNNDNFLRSSAFSPDGSTILSYSEEKNINIYSLNPLLLSKYNYYAGSTSNFLCESNDCLLSHNSTIQAGESIYDAKWYSHMNANDPSTNCFITTARDHPITLWDTQSGSVRATYSGINHLDELDPAVSLAFNLTGDKIYAGSNKMIR
jgi:WD40 repeat protein